jgi:hypothetical protein
MLNSEIDFKAINQQQDSHELFIYIQDKLVSLVPQNFRDKLLGHELIVKKKGAADSETVDLRDS